MTCTRNGAVTVAWRLLVRYSVRLQRRLNFDRKSFEIFLGLDVWWEKGCFAAPWVELRRLLSEPQSSSPERRRTNGTPKMNSWCFFEGSSTSAIVRRQRPAPGQVMLHRHAWLSLVVWHVWRFLVRYNNGDGAAEWIKTIALSSPFSSTSNRRTALKLGTTDLRGLRNTLVQKN